MQRITGFINDAGKRLNRSFRVVLAEAGLSDSFEDSGHQAAGYTFRVKPAAEIEVKYDGSGELAHVRVPFDVNVAAVGSALVLASSCVKMNLRLEDGGDLRVGPPSRRRVQTMSARDSWKSHLQRRSPWETYDPYDDMREGLIAVGGELGEETARAVNQCVLRNKGVFERLLHRFDPRFAKAGGNNA